MPRSAPLVTALTLAILAGIAVSLPAAAIRPVETTVKRGTLVSPRALSYELAVLQANDGYTFFAVDLTGAGLERTARWRAALDQVRSAQFPVWGWVRTADGEKRAKDVLSSVPLDGLYVYGRDAVAFAGKLAQAGPPVVPILSNRDPRPEEGPFGVVLDAKSFPGSEIPLPVLSAARLEYADVARARRRAAGDYLVALVAVD